MSLRASKPGNEALGDEGLGRPSTEDVGSPDGVIQRSPWQLFWRRFRRDRAALVGLGFVVLLLTLALTAPVIAAHVVHRGPNQLDADLTTSIGLPAVGPSTAHWFGVDTLGRDIFVRTLYGARTSLLVALSATALSVVLGVLFGTLAGFHGRWTDTVISRTVDLLLSMPILLFAVGIAATCSISPKGCLGGLIRPGASLVVVIIGLFSWPYIARIVRGQVLSIREKEYVEAARSMGASNWRIMFREILPNLLAVVIVYATLIIPNTVLFEATLSFLGVGVPQSTPSWGRMIAEASAGELYTVAWWMLVFPGVALVLTTLAFNLVGDGLQDALNPQERR